MSRSIYRRHHYTLYELTPGYRSADGLTQHNSWGFRGPEFAIVKPSGRTRVVCMGESTTYCTGIPRDGDTYPARLEASLRAMLPMADIEVLNAGVGGYTSAENLLRFVFKVQPLAPDVVVFYYTHNDVHPRRLPTLSRDYAEYSKPWRASLADYLPSSLLSWVGWPADIGDRVRTYGRHARRGETSREHLTRNSSWVFRDNMESLAILAAGWRVRMLFVNPPYAFLDGDYDPATIHPGARAVHEHRVAVEEIAPRHGHAVYDLRAELPYPPYTDSDTWKSDLFLDKVHVNEKGAALMGELVARALLDRGIVPRMETPR